MDEQLKEYLDGMEARIMSTLEQVENHVISVLKSHEEDAIARKLQGNKNT